MSGDGQLYVAVGDAGKRSEVRKEKSPYGKVLRINPEGSIPPDNPDPDSRVFASGFRRPFGLDFQPGPACPGSPTMAPRVTMRSTFPITTQSTASGRHTSARLS